MLDWTYSETPSTLGSVTYEPPPAPFEVRIRLCVAEHAQRLAHGRAADAEVGGEHRLVRQPLSGLELAVDDALAQPLGNQLVLLARPCGYSMPSSRLPATDVGVLTDGSGRSAK